MHPAYFRCSELRTKKMASEPFWHPDLHLLKIVVHQTSGHDEQVSLLPPIEETVHDIVPLCVV